MTELRAPEVGGSNGHRGPTRTVGSVAPTLSRAALVPRRRLRLTALGLSMAALGGVGFAARNPGTEWDLPFYRAHAI